VNFIAAITYSENAANVSMRTLESGKWHEWRS